ncbi:hypothetical protein SBA7_110013 [Candidatus Sulfotelmatobacter sp. SbA7]|nr:hypothetical protein SBA7_110013 [Candidatus Sulfotelmatobacter sp. SbA7]
MNQKVAGLCIIPGTELWQLQASSSADPKQERSKTMKRSLRALLLLVGLVGTFAYAAVPKAPAPIGPYPLCSPYHPNCTA